jgi:hypothetical protein
MKLVVVRHKKVRSLENGERGNERIKEEDRITKETVRKLPNRVLTEQESNWDHKHVSNVCLLKLI